jgi:hypothetical protein
MKSFWWFVIALEIAAAYALIKPIYDLMKFFPNGAYASVGG